MHFLKPVIVSPALYKPLEEEIAQYFYELIYEPLYEAIDGEIGKGWFTRARKITNATKPELEEYFNQALRTGRIQYAGGQFRGLIDAKISRYLKSLGAHYNADWKSWGLPESDLTANMRVSIGLAQTRYENLSQTIFDKLQEVEQAAQDINLPMERVFQRIIQRLDVQATDSLRSVLIETKISDGLRDWIAKEYTRNLNYYIKGDVGKAVERIRQRVQENFFKGYRSDVLVKGLIDDFEISERKAKFLAAQETKLLSSTFRVGRFTEAGVEEFQWRTMGDNRVRERHRELNGLIFRYDNPPIIAPDGVRGLPGVAFGCRCIDWPILRR